MARHTWPLRTAAALSKLPALTPTTPHQHRCITQNFLRRKAEAAEQWEEQGKLIKEGKRPHILDTLTERGYVDKIVGNPETAREILRTKRIGVYTGVDPTADSIHLGNLLPLMVTFLMWMHGFQATSIIGGATARFGDPSGRTDSRPLLNNAVMSKNVTKVHYQVKALWTNTVRLASAYNYQPHRYGWRRIFNNTMWLHKLSLYDWMKRLAMQTRMGPMLGRSSVKTRLESPSGMNVAEFLYPFVQGWDFWHLYNKVEVQMQVGGSDQYGNILSGIEFVKSIRDSEKDPFLKMDDSWRSEPIGLTIPLLTDSAGNKFGKSEGNAIWLDATKTSAYDLYGWFIRQPDDQVERLLKLFTFIPIEQINKIMERQREDPPKRVAHHNLAFNLVFLVHGQAVALQTLQEHKTMYGSTVDPDLVQRCRSANVSEAPPQLLDDGTTVKGTTASHMPQMDLILPDGLIRGTNVSAVLIAAGLVASRTEALKMIKDGGVYVASQAGPSAPLFPGNLAWSPLKIFYLEEVDRYLIDGRLLILRRGKHNIRIIEIVSDDEYAALGQSYPGMPGSGRVRKALDDVMKLAESQGVTITRKELSDKIRFDQSSRTGVKIKSMRSGAEAAHAKELRDRIAALESACLQSDQDATFSLPSASSRLQKKHDRKDDDEEEQSDAHDAESRVELAKRRLLKGLLDDELQIDGDSVATGAPLFRRVMTAAPAKSDIRVSHSNNFFPEAQSDSRPPPFRGSRSSAPRASWADRPRHLGMPSSESSKQSRTDFKWNTRGKRPDRW